MNKFLTNIFGHRSRHNVITSRLSNFCLALFLTYASAASADDTEIYFTGLVEENPNVLFVLDRSGSMDNMGNSGGTRLEELQAALTGFIAEAAELANLNIGIMTYSLDVALEQPLVAIDENNAGDIEGVAVSYTHLTLPTKA